VGSIAVIGTRSFCLDLKSVRQYTARPAVSSPCKLKSMRVGREIQPRRYPRGAVRPDDFRVAEVRVREPGPGEVLVRNTLTSVDHAIRLRLAEHGPAGYFPAFPLGAAMDGIMTVGEVLVSRAPGFAPGDTVWHAAGWRDYAVVAAGGAALNGIGRLTRLDTALAPPEAYLGPLGGMGLTAYAGLFRVAELRPGDVVWVSAAAGATGSLAAQLAKLSGNRVIGSAGTDEKVAWLRDELGLDAAFNHRSGPVADALAVAAPEGIDVYFDNVGGDHLEAALGALRRRGRVALCGAVSQYDGGAPARGPANLFQAVANDLTLRGFRGSSYAELLPEMQRVVAGWLRAGRLRHRDGGAGAVARGGDDRQDARADRLTRPPRGGRVGRERYDLPQSWRNFVL
jgi:NADPH-dependent curcumin reductase CurA